MKTSETNKCYARRENNNGYLCAKIVIDVIFVIFVAQAGCDKHRKLDCIPLRV